MSSRPTLIVYRDELLGASETFIRAQAESLNRFQPFYVGLRPRPGLSLPPHRVHLVSGGGLAGRLKRARFKLLGPSLSLLRKLERLQPALIHAHFGIDATNAVALARALQIPLVATFHGYDATVTDEYLPGLYLRRREMLKNRAARFICVSEFIRRKLINQGFPAGKVQVHYTGIDTEFFRPDPAVPRIPVVLFVGRLVAKKGCRYAIEAMSRVQSVLPKAKLVVIGDGPMRAELQEMARANLRGFEFLGAREPGVVREWMKRASVFCTPSITAASGDAEGFGMVFAEAQALGLPVVSFASGGIPEAVAHEETGYLVKEGDTEGLSAGILGLLLNKELWAQFSEAGQLRVAKLFEIKKQAVALEHLYESVLGEWNQSKALGPAAPPAAPGVPSVEHGFQISAGRIQ